jgi:hypothetical protein
MVPSDAAAAAAADDDDDDDGAAADEDADTWYMRVCIFYQRRAKSHDDFAESK